MKAFSFDTTFSSILGEDKACKLAVNEYAHGDEAVHVFEKPGATEPKDSKEAFINFLHKPDLMGSFLNNFHKHSNHGFASKNESIEAKPAMVYVSSAFNRYMTDNVGAWEKASVLWNAQFRKGGLV